KAPKEVAAGVEHIDEATARTGNIIVFRVILLRVSNKNLAVKIPDTERSITVRKIRIGEAVGSHLVKTLIVRFNLAAMKIRHKQEVVAIGDTERRAFINGLV